MGAGTGSQSLVWFLPLYEYITNKTKMTVVYNIHTKIYKTDSSKNKVNSSYFVLFAQNLMYPFCV